MTKKDEQLYILKKSFESLSTKLTQSQSSNEKLKKEVDSLQIEN